MIRKFIEWFKRVIIGIEDTEEVYETTIMTSSELDEIKKNAEKSAEKSSWSDV